MLTWDLFRHYLLSRRAGALIRTVAWLCMAGVALGVMSLVVVISVMNGFNDQIRRRLLAVEAHLVVRVPGITQADLLKNHPVYLALQKKPGIDTQLFESQDVILRTVDGLFAGAIAKGVDAKSLAYILAEMRKNSQAAASAMHGGASSAKIDTPPVSEESTHLGPGEVLIGIDLARSLGVFEGDKITVIPPESLLLPPGEAPAFERATVKGLITTNLPDLDSKVVFYGRGVTFSHLSHSASREAGYEVRMQNPGDADQLKREIEKQGGVTAETWTERNSALFYALRMEKYAMGSVLALAALIASFSIVTVLVLLLMQKRKDIGLLMALGLSPRRTRHLFVRLGLCLSFIGIGGGMICGIVICLIVQRYPLNFLPDIYYDTTIPASLDPVFIAGILFSSLAIALVSAWIPARKHTAETPSDALRSQRQNLGELQ
jgi:lipoprotein-releasing system permease protein